MCFIVTDFKINGNIRSRFDGDLFARNLEMSVEQGKKGKSTTKNSLYPLLYLGTCPSGKKSFSFFSLFYEG